MWYSTATDSGARLGVLALYVNFACFPRAVNGRIQFCYSPVNFGCFSKQITVFTFHCIMTRLSVTARSQVRRDVRKYTF